MVLTSAASGARADEHPGSAELLGRPGLGRAALLVRGVARLYSYVTETTDEKYYAQLLLVVAIQLLLVVAILSSDTLSWMYRCRVYSSRKRFE